MMPGEGSYSSLLLAGDVPVVASAASLSSARDLRDRRKRAPSFLTSPASAKLDPDAQFKALEKKEEEMLIRIDTLERLHLHPIKEALDRIRVQKAELRALMDLIPAINDYPGPAWLTWVEGPAFHAVSFVVIFANMAVMVQEMRGTEEITEAFWICDQVFLCLYIAELILKARLHERTLLLGPAPVVCWNWIDLFIVCTGILDQWIMPVVLDGSKNDHHTGNLRVWRLLRMARLARLLKLVRRLISVDMSALEGPYCQLFIMGVILVNTITIGIELDVPWGGWLYLNHAFLFIYFMELMVRIKASGCCFFYKANELAWNLLDFTVVGSGVLEMWLLPLVEMVVSTIEGQNFHPGQNWLSSIVKLFRMLRLMRVLRLVRLVREIRPLYKLLNGIIQAMDGLKWVLFLTALLLYAMAILITSLVGHGLLYGEDDIPDHAQEIFGTVVESMFSLFKLMNDDQSVVAPLISSPAMKVIFVLVMVEFNWCILAILTSVISDHMISSTTRADKEDLQIEAERGQLLMDRKLESIFGAIDLSADGCIDEHEFDKMLGDEVLYEALRDASNLEEEALKALFTYASVPPESGDGPRVIYYDDFIKKMREEPRPVTERAFFQMEEELRSIERLNAKRFVHLCKITRATQEEKLELNRVEEDHLVKPHMFGHTKTRNGAQKMRAAGDDTSMRRADLLPL